MYNDDDVYQYIAHSVLLFYEVMMELSFVIIYSTMGLLTLLKRRYCRVFDTQVT